MNQPYKGVESYEAEDADLFFGRDIDARQLIAKIFSRRLTLLYAPSGAGKTSLLNARIIPGLEKRGWLAVRVRVGDDPIAAVWSAVLEYLLPAPELELQSLQNAAAALAELEPAEELTIGELLDRYDQLKTRDETKRKAIEPILVSASTELTPPETLITPFFHRVLRSTISLKLYTEHLALLGKLNAAPHPGGLQIGPGTRVSTLKRFLQSPSFVDAYHDTVRSLLPSGTNQSLADFLRNIAARMHERGLNFQLVLIFDQFEELFTRYGDGDSDDVPSYRLRERMFREIRDLHSQAGATGRESAQGSSLPLRLVISLRDEYLARTLDWVRDFSGATDEASFHLNFLQPEDATDVIKRPAIIYGYSYSEKTYETLVSGLTREGSYIEPTAMQIVCERLWQEQGQNLASEGKEGKEKDLPEIDYAVLDELKGVRGILTTFFTEFMLKELTSSRERFEALEMLQMLVTTSRTRNIVERGRLVEQPLRNSHLREDILTKLRARKIVREEQRLGGRFVEITHEFLIEPILGHIKAEMARDSRFRDALRSLAHFEGVNFRVGQELLSEEDFEALHEYYEQAKKAEQVRWPAWCIELMLRSAIVRSTEHGGDRSLSHRDRLRFWCNEFASTASPAFSEWVPCIGSEGEGRRSLSLEQLWQLNGYLDPREDSSSEQRIGIESLSVGQLELIVRSQIWEADDSEREYLHFWTEKLLERVSADPN